MVYGGYLSAKKLMLVSASTPGGKYDFGTLSSNISHNVDKNVRFANLNEYLLV